MNEFYNRERAAQRLPSNRVIERNSIKFWEEGFGEISRLFLRVIHRFMGCALIIGHDSSDKHELWLYKLVV